MGFLKKFRSAVIFLACISLVFYSVPIFAQTTASSTPLSPSDQALLQQQLQDIENQIAGYQQQLSQTTAQKNTLANKIKTLKKQQALLALQIQATNLRVADLGNQIVATQNSIDQNNLKIQDLKVQVSGIIRVINQNDQNPFLYSLVTQQKLSDVFSDYENYAQISESLGKLLDQGKQINDRLTAAKQQLAVQQQDAENLLSIKILQQSQLAGSVNEQNSLLQQTKGQEASYQNIISDTQKQAAAIRSRLYELLGISTQITFGDALKIAQWTQGATGIDPAFLLAILTQESNLGQNVGTCNRPGDPPEKSWRVVMKPDRDIQPFLQITGELGLNPDITPVSCPMRDKNGRQLGWGGAMGPAQFIPSTWLGYKDQVSALTGKTANPWDIRDAFLAAAIKLSSNGADGTAQGEWNAAMRYFSGSTNTRYRFYGDSVMATTAKYQTDINNLGQ